MATSSFTSWRSHRASALGRSCSRALARTNVVFCGYLGAIRGARRPHHVGGRDDDDAAGAPEVRARRQGGVECALLHADVGVRRTRALADKHRVRGSALPHA